MSATEMLSVTDDLLCGGHDLLLEHITKPTSSHCYLAVAKLTVALQVLAAKVYEVVRYSLDFNGIDDNTSYLFSKAEKYCPSDCLNDTQTASGPLWYLMRYIVRKFDTTTLRKVLENKNFQWILPSKDFRQVRNCIIIILKELTIGRRLYRYCSNI